MEGTKYLTKDAILERAQEAIGIPLRDIDKTGRLATGKGAIGTVIEESWFGYTPNSNPEPDFPEAGVELKVTPYTRGKSGIRAKERLVCDIINYMEEYKKTFETSSFWHKCNTMLLMSYEHLMNQSKGNYTIDRAILFRFPEEDLAIIRHDWEIIIEKIRNGEAHLLSEGDTLYLAACTKGANASSVREQPFSDIPAKQRAYSLKSSYMTTILRSYIFGNEENENIIKDSRVLQSNSFEDYLIKQISPYYGKTQNELKELFGIEGNPKNINERILARMLGIQGHILKTEEFQKANIVPKTIRVQKTNRIKESMSFPVFDFKELYDEECWEDSKIYELLAPTKFLFVIFKENDDGEYILERVMFWNMPNQDLEEVRRVWLRTRNTIRRGVKLIQSPHGISNDLPKIMDSPVAHVRPHGRDASDTLPLPDGREMTKQCFWLNRGYIEKVIGLSDGSQAQSFSVAGKRPQKQR